MSLRFCQSGLEILGAAKGAAGPRVHGHSVGLVELVANGRGFVMNPDVTLITNHLSWEK